MAKKKAAKKTSKKVIKKSKGAIKTIVDDVVGAVKSVLPTKKKRATIKKKIRKAVDSKK